MYKEIKDMMEGEQVKKSVTKCNLTSGHLVWWATTIPYIRLSSQQTRNSHRIVKAILWNYQKMKIQLQVVSQGKNSSYTNVIFLYPISIIIMVMFIESLLYAKF